MKRHFLYFSTHIIVFFLLIGLKQIYAQTVISAGIVNGVWTLVGSPYLVSGNIEIPNDSTLTIEPGVTVEMQGHFKLQVMGRLLAVGNLTDTIVFTVLPDSISTGWHGIRFNNTSSVNDSSMIIYSKIQYGRATGSGSSQEGGAIYLNNFSKLRITNSKISNNSAYSFGGGIFCYNSSPLISNNIIANNSTLNVAQGGAIFCYSSDPQILSNTITNNTSGKGAGIACSYSNPYILNNTINTNVGGGIFCVSSSPLINNNILSGNSNSNGAGILCESNSNPNIISNTITYNIGWTSGGGVSCIISSNANIINNIISNNSCASSLSSGGGIIVYDSSPLIKNNIITYNSADNSGGGIVYTNSYATTVNNIIANNNSNNGGGGLTCTGGSPKIISNIIVNNSAGGGGGGILCGSSSPSFINNTIVNNTSNQGGGLFCGNNGNPIFINTILWGNSALNNGQQVYLNENNCDPSFDFCDIQGGASAFGLNLSTGVFYSGNYTNNLDSSPNFVAPTAGPGTSFNGLAGTWSLQSISALIDAGKPNTSGLNLPLYDVDSNYRISCRIDIGAFEYPHDSIVIVYSIDTASSGIPDGAIYLNVSGGTPPYNYAWSSGGPNIAEATGLAAGTYFVTVSDSIGCEKIISITIPESTGLEETLILKSQFIEVFPNPSQGVFEVILAPGLFKRECVIIFYSALSQVIYKSTIKNKKTRLDFSEVPAGLYFIQVISDGQKFTKRLIITK